MKTVVVNNGMREGNCDDRKMGAATPGSDARGRQIYTNGQGKSDRCNGEAASDAWISRTTLVIENGNDDLANKTVYTFIHMRKKSGKRAVPLVAPKLSRACLRVVYRQGLEWLDEHLLLRNIQ